MADSKTKQTTNSKNWTKATIAGVLLVVVVVVALWAFHLMHSDAVGVASSLDKELTSNGATRVCEEASAGHGPDDLTPAYTAYYETSLNRDQAAALINDTAKSSGFNLKHAQAKDLSVPDIYVNNWYFDYMSKTSQLPWAEKGPIKLTFVLGNASTTTEDSSFTLAKCGNKKNVAITNDKDHVAIQLKVELPRNKW